MLISLKSIPSEGLEINQALSLEKLEERLAQGRQADIKFLEAPVVSIRLTPTTDGAESRGKIKLRYLQNCGLCSKSLPQEVELSAKLLFKPRPKQSEELELTDSPGVFYFTSDQIDIEDSLQENIILSLSLYWTPPRAKDGTCLVCHNKTASSSSFVPKGQETRMASLLKPIRDKIKH